MSVDSTTTCISSRRHVRRPHQRHIEYVHSTGKWPPSCRRESRIWWHAERTLWRRLCRPVWDLYLTACDSGTDAGAQSPGRRLLSARDRPDMAKRDAIDSQGDVSHTEYSTVYMIPAGSSVPMTSRPKASTHYGCASTANERLYTDNVGASYGRYDCIGDASSDMVTVHVSRLVSSGERSPLRDVTLLWLRI